MRKQLMTVPFRANSAQAVATQVVTPYERPVMKVAKDAFNLDPDYVRQIQSYGEQRTQKVIANFIGDPVLLSSFYELLGMLPYEIEDIQKNVRAENVRMALIETDDLIEKLITWRIKLSHKFSV